MLKALTLLLASVSQLVSSKAPSKCATELEGILFEPQSYARQYLAKVAANFNLGKAALFTPQAGSYLQSFEQEWGVTIEVNDPSNICTLSDPTTDCSFTSVPPNLGKSMTTAISSFPFIISEDYLISYLSINFTGTVGTNQGLGQYTLTSPAGTTITLSNTNICDGVTDPEVFTLGFADNSTTISVQCSDEQNVGIVIKPYQPLSTFNGERTAGTWFLTGTNYGNLDINLIQLNYCQGGTHICPRNVMKALINVPGFRVDSGVAVYTEDLFDAFGNFKQVTFSSPISGLILKK